MRSKTHKALALKCVEHARDARWIELVKVGELAGRAGTVLGQVAQQLGLTGTQPNACHIGVKQLFLRMRRSKEQHTVGTKIDLIGRVCL